ncbi:MAG: ribosome-associated translation inhibitor RaiA [Patescibacteria group bacterium]
MKINIKATGIELTPAISNYTERKISSLNKYLDKTGDVVAQVEVGKSTKHHKTGEVFMAEVHLMGSGLDLYAVSEQSDLYAAIDLVKDEITRNLTHLKGKRETLGRRGAQAVKNMIKGLNFFIRRK